MSNLSSIRPFLVLGCIILSSISSSTHAQDYPSKPVRVIVSYTPGGGTDAVIRIVAKKFYENTGQNMVVEYKPGAAEQIGTAFGARAAPDGYTVLVIGNPFSINPSLYSNLPYDTVRDFAPVTLLAVAPFALLVNPELPVKTLKEFATLAKTQPGKLNYSSLGVGSPQQLSMEWYKKLAGLDIVPVPFNGVAPAMTAAMAGDVQATIAGLTTAVPHIKAGRLRALAVTTAKRSSAAPELPTIAESGFPEFDSFAWYGLVVPAKTPPGVIKRLNDEVVRALNSPEVRGSLTAIGVDSSPMTPEAFAAFLHKDLELWTGIVKMIGAKAE
jgi:tripartite-type tricarboxylate transporter receptor subunit TctC